ncbi:energy transducer TonB, partial [Cetobacterium sp.]
DQNRFLQGEDGVFTAISLDGIEYEILKEVDPQYPIKARKIGYNGVGSIKVNFLVDIDGTVKDVKFISGESKFGFREEVEKALKKWKFKPIIYKGKIIKVHFEKEFKFKKN